MIKYLDVFFNNYLVGTLGLFNNRIIFSYSDSWIKDGFSISPFYLPLKKETFTCNHNKFSGLFGVFNDSYVDSWGELLINRYLSSKGIKYNELSILDKLSIIGNVTMGGLTYKPSSDIKMYPNNISYDELYEDICNIIESKKANNIDDLFSLGGSSGGTRPKILTRINNRDVIVKFRAKIDPLDIAKKEYLYFKYAQKLGINVPNFDLIHGKKSDYFVIERFDKQDDIRKFVISASGLLECDYNIPSLDYLDLFKLTSILSIDDKKEILELFRRMVFNVVFENMDDHAKNFSYIYNPNNKHYELSPAYDLTPSTTYFGEHTTSVNHKGKDILDSDLLAVATTYGITKQVATDIIILARKLKEQYDREIDL